MAEDLLRRMAVLREAGEAFAVATVVRAERPTSARPGAKAIVHADGTIEGWIGGSCAQPLVAEEAKRALADGQPRLLHLSPKVLGEWAAREGVVSLEMTCFSGGTLEIFIEPMLPRPHLALVGASPVIETLARLGQALNYGVTVIDPHATLEQYPGAEEVLTTLDLRQAGLRPHSHVVIASHGYYDEDAVQQALLSDARYVALVASPKRTVAVVEYLREQGVAEARLGRLKGPAGLDLGAQTPDEIAVSILAEMVKVSRETSRQVDREVGTQGDRETGKQVDREAERQGDMGDGMEITFQERRAPLAETAIDRICGMTVEKATARHTTVVNGETYYFCCAGCKREFEKQAQAE